MVTEYDWILCISRWCNFMLIETCAFGKFGNTYLSKGELIGMVETPPYSNDSLSSTCFAFIYIYTIFIYICIYGYDKVKIRKTEKEASIFDPSTNDQHDQLSFHSLPPCDERRSENSSPGSCQWDKLQWETLSLQIIDKQTPRSDKKPVTLRFNLGSSQKQSSHVDLIILKKEHII